MEKFQTGTSYHKKPKIYIGTVGEKKRPTTKIEKYKGSSTNDVTDEEGKKDEGGKNNKNEPPKMQR